MLAYTMAVLQHVLEHHLHMLYNRHLDQLMLCCLYGVCKVLGLESVTFSRLTQHYRHQPQARRDVYKSVVLTQTPDLQVQQHGNIVDFYNHVFIAPLTDLLLKVRDGEVPINPSLPGLGPPPPRGQPLPPPRLGTISSPPGAAGPEPCTPRAQVAPAALFYRHGNSAGSGIGIGGGRLGSGFWGGAGAHGAHGAHRLFGWPLEEEAPTQAVGSGGLHAPCNVLLSPMHESLRQRQALARGNSSEDSSSARYAVRISLKHGLPLSPCAGRTARMGAQA